eukprot:TRINITY_DN31244_c0_g1_i1.p1 TRINITY_DN31244_c0_g1~~TRINITY_DN31244_c0_g1_i1.p1  ORF type:complete len:523 (-),score=211.00 TRINITY_DN31244_c0_g1_i1:51-1619(-)
MAEGASPRWAHAERALEAKKREMTELLHAAQAVGPISFGGSGMMSPISMCEPDPDEGDDQERTLALESKLHQKSVALDNLLNDKRNIEQYAAKQSASVLDLSNELAVANDRIATLSLELRTRQSQQKDYFSRQKTRFLRSAEKTDIVDRVRQEMLATAPLTSVVSSQGTVKGSAANRESTMAEMYYMCMQLENQVRDANRVIAELRAENKDLHRLVRVRDEEFSKLKHTAVTAAADTDSKLEYVRQISDLQNQRRQDAAELEAVRGENELLNRIHQAKTTAILHLTQEVNAREYPTDIVNEYKQQLQVLRDEASAAQAELKRSRRQIEEQAVLIAKQTDELRDKGVPFKLWSEERRLLQAEIRNLQDERDVQDTAIARQKQRIQQLHDRLTSLTKFAGSPRSPSASRSSAPKPSFAWPDEGDGPASEVPFEVFANLERLHKRVSEQLAAAQAQLAEKDDAIQTLEKKTQVLAKATSSDARLARQRAVELEDKNAILRQQVEFLVGERKELLGEIHSFKARNR